MATRSNYDDPFYNLFSFGEPRTIIDETCPTMSVAINADGSISLSGTTRGSWLSIPFDKPLYIINGSYAFSVSVLSGASSLISVTTTPILYQLKPSIELSNRTGTQDVTFTKIGALEDYSTYTHLLLRIGTEGTSTVEQETIFNNFSFRPTLYCLSCTGIYPGEEGKRRTNFFNDRYNHFPQSGKQTIRPNGIATLECFPSWYQPGGYHRLIGDIPVPEWYHGQHQKQNLTIYVNSDSSITINGIIVNDLEQPYELPEPFFYIPTYTASSAIPNGSDYGQGVWGLQPEEYKFSIKVLSDINSIRFYSNPKSESCLEFTIKIHKSHNDYTFIDPDGNAHVTIPIDANKHHEYMRNFNAKARGDYALFNINFYGTIEFNNFTFKPYVTLYSDEQYFAIIETDNSPALELNSVSQEQWGESIYINSADMIGSFEGEEGSIDLTVSSNIQQNDFYHSPVQLGRLNNQLEQFFDYNSIRRL